MTDVQDHATDLTSTDEAAAPQPTTSRRSLVSKGAIAAAVGAAAGIALSSTAHGANGDTVLAGRAEDATATTLLTGGTTFRVNGGFSSGSASIYGVNSGSGRYGVRGEYDGSGADGAGVYGVHSGSVSGIGVQGLSALGTGIHGRSEATSGGIGVLGESTSTEGVGVFGQGLGTRSVGVRGESTTSGSSGVEGIGARADLVAAGSGVIRISATVATDVTPTSGGQSGAIARNSDGSLWYYAASSTWRKIAGATTGGAFHPVTPFRVYDSRKAPDGRLNADASRTLSVSDARDVSSYVVTTADALPEGATAVAANVVAVGTSGTGFCAINPGGISTIGASALNWISGQNIGNAGTFTLNDSRELQVVVGPNTSLHLTIDITGYYL